jgi:ribonuclease R
VAHRILFANLQGELRVNSKMLESQCMYISNQERKAMEAERDSVRFFQVLFMKSRVGDEFDGRIRGMNERGFYIDLTGTQCEGFLPIENLDEELTFKPGRMAAHSIHSTQTWKIGDKIKVKLLAADIEDKELLLGLAH